MLVVMLFSTSAMTACNKGDKRTPDFGVDLTSVPSGGYDGSEQTIYFYHTMGAALRAVLEEYIAEFNKIYPNIKIKHEQVGSYDDVKSTVSTEITEGLQPHIAYCYPDHVAAYNVAGAVQTLDVLINSNEPGIGLSQENIDDIIPGYYEEGRQFGDNLMYTMPFSKSTEVLYYNKTFFDANDLKVPTTWDEMEEVCRAIKALDPTSIPLGYDSESNWFITMCEQLKTPYTSATGNKYLFDNAENKEFIKEFISWYQEGFVTTQEIYGAYTSELFKSSEAPRSYMSIGSSAGANHQCPDKDANGKYPFEVGIVPIPQADLNNKKVISQGPSVCIFKKTNPQEVLASWLFVKYLILNPSFQADFSIASGYVPVIKSVANDEIYQEHLAKADYNAYLTALSSKVCLEQADYYYTSPAFNGSSLAREQVGALVQNCLVGAKKNWTAAQLNDFLNTQFADAVKYCEQLAPSNK